MEVEARAVLPTMATSLPLSLSVCLSQATFHLISRATSFDFTFTFCCLLPGTGFQLFSFLFNLVLFFSSHPPWDPLFPGLSPAPFIWACSPQDCALSVLTLAHLLSPAPDIFILSLVSLSSGVPHSPHLCLLSQFSLHAPQPAIPLGLQSPVH